MLGYDFIENIVQSGYHFNDKMDYLYRITFTVFTPDVAYEYLCAISEYGSFDRFTTDLTELSYNVDAVIDEYDGCFCYRFLFSHDIEVEVYPSSSVYVKTEATGVVCDIQMDFLKYLWCSSFENN